MGKQRQTNFELLRILLMIAIPLYHLMVYGGVIYLPYNKFTLPGLIICSGSAIVADYAFMSLSAYFLLDKNNKPVISRFLKLFIQVFMIYLVKKVIICDIYGYSKDITFYNDFFIKGSWWFIYVYFIILLIYPLLNKIIFQVDIFTLKMICVVLGILFIINGCTNNVNMINDILGFIFTYFVTGYLKRNEFNEFLGIQIKKRNLLIVLCVGYGVTLALCYYFKVCANVTGDVANVAIQHLVGKYSFIQFIMGISVFLFFRLIHVPVIKWINNIAQNVFYVFLLHETVLAIFWYYGKFRTIDNQLPFANAIEFVSCCSIYVISSFLFAIVIRFIYQRVFQNLFEKWIDRLCNMSFIQKIENKYHEVTAWEEKR